MSSIDQRIEAIETRIRQLRLQKQQVEARKRAEQSKRQKSEELRRKILIGAAILDKVERGEWTEAKLRELMAQVIVKADERALFGLLDLGDGLPLPSAKSNDAKPQGRSKVLAARAATAANKSEPLI
ncbi:MAG: hypothetical protein V4723_04925 [Pseudomonadota bacterium]